MSPANKPANIVSQEFVTPTITANSFLSRILDHKRREVESARRRMPLAALERRLSEVPPARDFAHALRQSDSVAVIAEMKKASPSAGTLRRDYDPHWLAQQYAENGAGAISVLTDAEFFQGSLEHVKAVRRACELPVLRKDFIIDAYQIAEARCAGADAVLLIVAALTAEQLNELQGATAAFDLHALIEVHNERELEIAISQNARIIGINNRNLRTFEISLATSQRLLPLIPADHIRVAESGIRRRDDVSQLAECGLDAVLVGSHLMQEAEPGNALKSLTGVNRDSRQNLWHHPS